MAKNEKRIWDGVSDDDFINERNIAPVDIAEYDEHNMTLYAVNVNCWRQLIRLSDSLKPVERRILYTLYLAKAFPGHKLKSTLITGNTMVYHGHGDASTYTSLIGMAQGWKKQCPLIEGKGNFGNAARPEMYAQMRYTEASMSKYARECFFDDYDEDCVETVFNSASDLYEPMSLPAKFPNVLVNGGMGIAFGNAFRIPTYHIPDIIEACKAVIREPDTANVYMVPDLPSGCTILDDGENFREIINEGKGILKMRADAEIIDTPRNWIIKFTSLPWMTSLTSIEDRIVQLAESGVIPIKDKQDHSYAVKDSDGNIQTKVDFRLLIDKSHDPQTILNKLYMTTDLQKSVSIDFKVVLDDFSIKRLNMRDLILSWLDERRSYKRRLFNKRLTKISARIELLNILIYLLKEDNIEKTIGIIKNSDSEEVINNLMKLAKMSSFQATRIADMRLSAFTKDARKRYKEERDKLEIERKDLMTLIRSEKRIDKIICDELEDLRKYARPRRSNIVSASTEKHIANTTHNIVVSKDGYLKKLAYYEDAPNKNSNMGAFKSGDYPIHHLIAHNTTSIVLFDTFGRYSILPVHEIDTTEPSQYGHQIFDITKLSGRIVKCFEAYDNDLIKVMKKKVGEPYLLTITRRGYGKKTPMETYTDMKNTRNIRAMKIRDDDAIAVAEVMFDSSTLIIYTKKGEYSIIKMKDIAEQVKDAMGLITMRVQDDDEVAGVAVIGDTDDYVLVMSEKGMCKRVPIQYFGAPGRRGVLRDQGSMMTLDPTDAIRFVSGMTEDQDLVVGMRSGVTKIPGYSIPNTTKKSKGKKLVFPGSGANIVVASIIDRK